MKLAQATWAPGTQFSRYEILGRLARGGMAEVWRAAASGVEGFRRQVVIKTMRPELAVSPDLVRMFINEATIAARLSHPAIIHVFDFGQLDERYFIVMEYVPGMSLRQLGRALRERRLRLPRRLVLRTAAAVARTLAYAHGARDRGVPLGFVHRDVSPENIMVSSEGATKLIDFGAAMTSACPPPQRTFVGKLRYLSPERLRGEPGDARSDIYALGIVLYECLTGRRPYDGANVPRSISAGGAADPCLLVPTLPPRVGATILRAIALDPEARYPRASDLADELADLAKGRLGRDPLGATEEQAAAVLRASENENDEHQSENEKSAPIGRGPAAAGMPARATDAGPGGQRAVSERLRSSAPVVRTGHLNGTSVAVVVNDSGDSDEGNEINPPASWGSARDLEARLSGGREDEDVADSDDENDDDGEETKLFMGREAAPHEPRSVVTSVPGAIVAPVRLTRPVDAVNVGSVRRGRRPPSKSQAHPHREGVSDGVHDDGRIASRKAPVTAEARDPLEVVQRSLPELHSTAWFGPGLPDARVKRDSPPRLSDGLAGAAGDVEPASTVTAPAAVRSVSAAACFERGLQLIAAKDLAAALVQWRRASALDPDRAWYRTNLERLVRHIESDPGRG